MKEAKKFARENLSACAADILEWRRIGVLPNGSFQELARMVEDVTGQRDTSLDVAREIVTTVALEYVAKPERG